MSGRAGDDSISGDGGQDTMRGGEGDDQIYLCEFGAPTEPTAADQVFCGPGVDTVVADPSDTIAADCENVQIRN